VFIQKFGTNLQNSFLERIEQHYKFNGVWKQEYIIASFLSINNKDKIIELDTDGELKETFLNYVSINSSITQELPRFTPSFKKPKLTYDQMMNATMNQNLKCMILHLIQKYVQNLFTT